MKNDDPKQLAPCDDNSCDCKRTWARRDFLSLTAVATAGALAGGRSQPVMAGPFANENEYLKTIPTDKKLDPAWIASLSTRGEKETYSDPAALRHIGMPVGGLFAGTVYLSGDGRLWLWDIFNKDQTGILPRSVPLKAAFHGSPISGGLNYVHPAPLTLPFELVFAIRHEGKRRTLDSAGFSSVTFDGRYPLGRVAYREESCPLDVALEAFSPFIPLNVADSSLPATVMQYTVKNRGNAALEVELLGHIQIKEISDYQGDVGGKGAQVANSHASAPGADVGQVGRKVQLAPGESVTIAYVVTWHFPNLYGRGLGNRRVGHSYAARFDSAIEVARYVAENFDRLAETTRRWVDTWYDSTLPFWFLDRTMANTSTLATTTCCRLADGRFWAWEGIGCCQGTCTHVWHYAQALGRLFPEIERGQREQVDFGMALHEDGGIGPGCYIDQIFGQTWAHWVGLGRLFDRDKQLSALRALWKYNFVPDVGPFREKFPRGRWYALAGDAGLLMCTWPKGGQNPDFKKHWQYMYFNECMSGFEWQAAAGMIAEGIDQPDLLQNGLAIARAIHDRYNARLRNPYNEIECSDHYARAMASYGAYQAACGYTYHGPKGRLGFAPRLTPENFKAAFTAAEGWGSYQQRIDKETKTLHATIELKWGQLRLRALDVPQPFDTPPSSVVATVDGTRVDADIRHEHGQSTITFAAEVLIAEGHSLCFTIQ